MRHRRTIEDRYIPQGAVKIADKQSDAVAYLYVSQRNGPLCAIVYYGKQSKAVAHHNYKNEAEREKSVRRYFEGRRQSIEGKAEYKARRLCPNKLEVADILRCSWGYDQTNVDFFEVTEKHGQHVVIRKIGAASETTGHDCGQCVPQSGQFIGEPMRKLVQYGDSVRIYSFASARKWNTHEVAGVKLGPAAYWSSYA